MKKPPQLPRNGVAPQPLATEGTSTMSDKIPFIDAASTLGVVALSREPLLFLSDDLKVVAASASFCRHFQLDPSKVSGKRLADLGNGEWASPKIDSLLRAAATGGNPIEAYEFDLVRKGEETRHLLLSASKLTEGEQGHLRLLLVVSDVTEARAQAKQKDELIREKAVYLQEVQHRVANSLQIVASVLMQGARRIQSEEARGHLFDAHHRVLSIAAVQRQLASTSLADVALRPYLDQLCHSIGASMIRDPKLVSIEVAVDESSVDPDTSVCLGLIVTELVINALKHAFPRDRHGKIIVGYREHGLNWTLSVSDNGVGMPTGPDVAKPGLGTGIVEALAKQLKGKVEVANNKPGTLVSIEHLGTAADESDIAAA